MFRNGVCHRVVPPFNCDRVCDNLELGGLRTSWTETKMGKPEYEKNVVLLSGDRVVTAHCKMGEDAHLDQVIRVRS